MTRRLFNNNNIVRRCVCTCVRAWDRRRDREIFDHGKHDNFTLSLPLVALSDPVIRAYMYIIFSSTTNLSETFNYAHKTKSLTLFTHLPRYTYNAYYTRSWYEIHMNINPMLTTFITQLLFKTVIISPGYLVKPIWIEIILFPLSGIFRVLQKYNTSLLIFNRKYTVLHLK